MTQIKRLLLLILFATFAIGTRMIVRYGVRGAMDWVTTALGLSDEQKEVANAPGKPAARPKRAPGGSPQNVPIVQTAPPPAAPGAGPSTPAPSGTPAMGPSAPSIVGPINAARQVAAASNRQLSEETGQETAPVKGARQQNPATQTAASQPPASQPPANNQPSANNPPPANTTAPSQAPVMQQGAPAAPSASAPTVADTKGAPKAPPVDAKVAVAPNVKAAAPDTARRPVMRETFDYARDSRRDPFISLMTTSDLRPTITDLRLTGILYDLSGRRPVAILRDVAGGQWRVTTGMTLGRMRVANIKPKVIVFTIEEFGFNRQDSLILGDTTRVRRR